MFWFADCTKNTLFLCHHKQTYKVFTFLTYVEGEEKNIEINYHTEESINR